MRSICLALATALAPLSAFAATSTPPAPKITASSSKEVDKKPVGPELAFDGLLETAWLEGAKEYGVGEWIEIDLGEDKKVETISIWGGHFAGKDKWKERGRLGQITVSVTDAAGKSWQKSVEIGDRYGRKDVAIPQAWKVLRITVDEAHPGTVFEETAISEIAFDFGKPVDPLWKEAMDKAIAKNKAWKEAAAKTTELRDGAYTKAKANEEYSASFDVLASLALRGPSYLVEAVGKHVPPGFRLQHLQPDLDAIDKIVRLKDGNAVQVFEMAAAGSTDAELREDLYYQVKRLDAYNELRKPSRKTVPNWGSTGLEQGALFGKGEPLSFDVDSSGNLWVADTGNNRLQRFTAAGTVDKVICAGTKDIVERWFGDEDEPYASGCKSGTENGQFEQPLFVTVGNYDIVAVVDATMRVQTFDVDGNFKAAWKIETDWAPKAGRGNATPIIRWLGDDFYVIIKNEVFVYSNAGALKKRYPLEGGDVQSAVIAAGGKLLVRHVGTRDIVEYNPADGFRQGLWSKSGVPDDGSEDWDLATDAKDNVYVVTDAGKVYKWNKRGKFLAEFQAFENGRDMPRIAVNGPVIYVSARDEIARIEQDE